MKKFFLLALTALSMTGCWTSIWTVAPTVEPVAPVKTVYTTQVTTPSPKVVTTTTVTVTSFNNDWSFYLDLQAVAAAFAESSSVQEFERILNSSRYMINNLDLNRDGWVDYLRVIETYQGYRHVFLIQACLAPSVFQDVATLIAEWQANKLYVEVIGDRYLYGYNYVVRPVFVKRPPMWDLFGRPTYNPWMSPYYYGYWPSYYQKPKPIYLNHYQAYVNTYMTNHHYCRHCDYPKDPYWTGYTTMTQPHQHNDYATQHPNDSFEKRVTNQLSASGATVSVRNAGQLRTETQRQAKTTEDKSSAASSATATPRTSGSTSTSGTSGSSRTSGTSTTSGTSARTSTTTQPSTSVNTRVNKSGTTRTTIKTTDTQGRTTTVKRESQKAQPETSTRTNNNNTSARTGSTSTRTEGTSGRTGSTTTRKEAAK